MENDFKKSVASVFPDDTWINRNEALVTSIKG